MRWGAGQPASLPQPYYPTVGKGAGIVAPELVKQIDYIFVSPEFEVLRAWVPDSTVSDHWPIMANLEVK